MSKFKNQDMIQYDGIKDGDASGRAHVELAKEKRHHHVQNRTRLRLHGFEGTANVSDHC